MRFLFFILFGFGFSASAVDMAWDAASWLDGRTEQITYRLMIGDAPGNYTNSVVAIGTQASVALAAGTYYLAVRAESGEIISENSNEIRYTATGPTVVNVGIMRAGNTFLR